MKVLVPDRWLDRIRSAAEGRGVEVEPVVYGEGAEGPFPSVEVFFWAWPSSVRREAFAAAPDVRWVHSASAGVDALVPLVRERGVRLTESGACYRIPIGEFVMAAMLDAACRLGDHHAAHARGEWEGFGHTELAGRTVGIVGLGPIGLGVAERAAAFGMNVIGCRRSGRPVENVTDVVAPDGVARLWRESDYIVLAAPLTTETRGIVDAEALAMMKPSGVLINIARGALVDTDALLAALWDGRPGRAILDVTDPEPLPEAHPLWEAPGLLITSHTAGGGDAPLCGRLADRLVENLARDARDEPLPGVVDLEREY